MLEQNNEFAAMGTTCVTDYIESKLSNLDIDQDLNISVNTHNSLPYKENRNRNRNDENSI